MPDPINNTETPLGQAQGTAETPTPENSTPLGQAKGEVITPAPEENSVEISPEVTPPAPEPLRQAQGGLVQPPSEPASAEATVGKPINPPNPLYQGGIINLLQKAKEKILFRKRVKLEKIMVLAQSRTKITNNDVQKLLRSSDATATRYLAELVKQGRLRRVGPVNNAFYEFLDPGSSPG